MAGTQFDPQLLLEARDEILASPATFDMDTYFGKREMHYWGLGYKTFVIDEEMIPVNDFDPRTNDCGTVCCIAGRVKVIMARRENGAEVSTQNNLRTASYYLGIRQDQADGLFIVGDWPEPFRTQYREAEQKTDYVAMALIAAYRIEHFIASMVGKYETNDCT
jgi:hypothetical protein